MAKRHIFKKSKHNIKKEHILWAVILVLIALQVVSAIYLVRLWNYQTQTSKASLRTFIAQIEESRYKNPVIDITENRVYIPEARVYLPLNETTRNLRYEYISSSNRRELRLSMSGIIGRQNDTDDPSCDRAVVLHDEKEAGSGNEPVGTIEPTKDGLVYIFAHSKNTCKIYDSTTPDALVDAAKEIKSY